MNIFAKSVQVLNKCSPILTLNNISNVSKLVQTGFTHSFSLRDLKKSLSDVLFYSKLL